MIKKGFTLIELLVVIAIIGILAALVTVSFTSSQRQARDTTRKSDLSQYRTSLESYANQTNGIYPAHSGATHIDTATLCADLNLSSCALDPKDGTTGLPGSPTFGYYYISDAAGTKYAVYAYLENTSGYWVTCSNGTSKLKAGTATPTQAADCP